MITSHHRGHPIEYKNNNWMYIDNGEVISNNRPCVRCGKLPTVEGYDACLGHVEGAISACCGHGVEGRYIMKSDKENVQ